MAGQGKDEMFKMGVDELIGEIGGFFSPFLTKCLAPSSDYL